MVLTKVAVADDPAHSASTKPMLMMSARPPCRTSCTVGVMTWLTTSLVNARLSVDSISCSIRFTVPGPNQRET